MLNRTSLTINVILLSLTVCAEPLPFPKAKVSYEDFKHLVEAVEKHRESRLIDLDRFLEMSRDENTIILDSRSTFRFDRIHVKGAKHLSFSDFTQANLGRVIPDFDKRILIYCNNNFKGNEVDFATKVAMPNPSSRISTQFRVQEKPLMMALNIPTFINLYGYGYHNVYELNELVDVGDERIEFEGSLKGSPVISPSLSVK